MGQVGGGSRVGAVTTDQCQTTTRSTHSAGKSSAPRGRSAPPGSGRALALYPPEIGCSRRSGVVAPSCCQLFHSSDRSSSQNHAERDYCGGVQVTLSRLVREVLSVSPGPGAHTPGRRGRRRTARLGRDSVNHCTVCRVPGPGPVRRVTRARRAMGMATRNADRGRHVPGIQCPYPPSFRSRSLPVGQKLDYRIFDRLPPGG